MKTLENYKVGNNRRVHHVTCQDCNVVVINKVICHERGCPGAFRDELRECNWCGGEFTPDSPHQLSCCDSCYAAYNNISYDEQEL